MRQSSLIFLVIVLCLGGCQREPEPPEPGQFEPPPAPRSRFEVALEVGGVFIDEPTYRAEYHPELNSVEVPFPDTVLSVDDRKEAGRAEWREAERASLATAQRKAAFVARVRVDRIEFRTEKLVLDEYVGAEPVRCGYAAVELVEVISGSPPDSFQFRFFDVSSRPRLSGEAVVALEQRGELLHLVWGLDVVDGRVLFGLEQEHYNEFRERL